MGCGERPYFRVEAAIKNILVALGAVGFHEENDHVGKSSDGQVSDEMIVNRNKTRKEVGEWLADIGL